VSRKQVEEQAKVLGKGLPFKTALVVGGDALPQQLHRIKQGVELIIGTPGRLIDLLSKHDYLSLQVHGPLLCSTFLLLMFTKSLHWIPSEHEGLLTFFPSPSIYSLL